MRERDMTQGRPIRLILLFALPIMLGNVFQQLYIIVDAAFVGRLIGMEALDAAVKSYHQGGKPVVFEQQAEKIVCHCFNVSEETIIKAIIAVCVS